MIKEIEEGMDTEFVIEIYVGEKGQNNIDKNERKYDTTRQRLERASEDFIVYRRSTDSHSIIAGYPWFNDWGRDAMISLPGILLETGKY